MLHSGIGSGSSTQIPVCYSHMIQAGARRTTRCHNNTYTSHLTSYFSVARATVASGDVGKIRNDIDKTRVN